MDDCFLERGFEGPKVGDEGGEEEAESDWGPGSGGRHEMRLALGEMKSSSRSASSSSIGKWKYVLAGEAL